MDDFRGETYHTALYQQNGVNLESRRVAVIGTGASGVQVIQNESHLASHLTIFQRTPSHAIPMTNPDLDTARHKELKDNFDKISRLIHSTFAGFYYEFTEGSVL